MYDTESWHEHPSHLLVLCFRVRDHNGNIFHIPDIPEIDDVHYVYTVEEFIKVVKMYFLDLGSDVYFIAHNGGRWDHYFIYRFFVDIEPNKTIRHNLKYINSGRVHFRDSVMYFPGKLEEIGSKFGVHKQDFDYMNCNPWYDRLELTKYCVQDVIVLDTVWFEFEKQILPVIHLPNYKLIEFNSYAHYSYISIASQISVPLYTFATWELYTWMAKCYYGGRVISSCWGMLISETVNLYDIVSMYPSCLLCDFPYGNIEGPIYNQEPPEDRMYIADVCLEKDTSDCISSQQPLVPVKTNGKLLFYDGGKLYGRFTSVDIETFKLDGWKVTFLASYVWTHKGTYLKDLYQECFDNRCKSDSEIFKYVWKIIMNSSYGKFGQYKFSEEESILSRYHPVAWFTTSWSRRILYHVKQIFKTDMYYGDTDSIVVPADTIIPEEFMDRKLSDISTGKIYFTKERTSDYICVIAKKTYSMQGVAKCKGANNCTEEHILSMLDGPQLLPVKKCKFRWTTRTCMFLDPIKEHMEWKRQHRPDNAYLCDYCNLYHYKLATI